MKIVFVHLGRKIPRHLFENVLRTHELFPEVPLILLAEDECKIPTKIQEFVVPISQSRDWKKISDRLGHPRDFRNNFWFTSLARLLALSNYMAEFPGEIIHVESDVLLAPDFPFEKFSQIKESVAYPVLSLEQGIASTLYIRNYSAVESLVEVCYSSAEANPFTTDMIILRNFFDSHGFDVSALPTGPPFTKYFREFTDPMLIEHFKQSVTHFGGIFDGLDLGYFLFGIDPRNDKGIRRVRRTLPNSLLKISEVSFSYSPERNFPNVVLSDLGIGDELPIFSLHIHSKDLRLFSQKSASRVILRACNNYLKGPTDELVLGVFIRSVYDAISRRIRNSLRMNQGRVIR